MESVFFENYMPYIDLLRYERREFCTSNCDGKCMKEKLANKEVYTGADKIIDIW